MNVLLTGGTGYIGSHTGAVLTELGHRVVLYDNLSNSNAAVVQKLSDITGQAINFVEGDVLDTALLTNTLATHKVEAVIHFAGLKAVGQSVSDPLPYYKNNVQGTISLLHAMKDQHIKKLVFSSSATVYGEPKYLPVDEEHPTNAVNPYGRTKLQIEELLRDVASSDPAWRIACLRYFNPVGAHESGLIGENPTGIPNNLMPYISQVAAGIREELSIFGNDYPTPDGTGIRDYIHVMDLAEGHAAALGYLSQTNGWHALNLGSGNGFSVMKMVQTFEEVSGRKVNYRIMARRTGDVAVCYADPQKAKRLLTWYAARTLVDMCASTWNFQRTTGEQLRNGH